MKKLLTICMWLLLPTSIIFAQDDNNTPVVSQPQQSDPVTSSGMIIHHDDEINSMVVGGSNNSGVVRHSSGPTQVRRGRTAEEIRLALEQQRLLELKELSKHPYIVGFRIQVVSKGNTRIDRQDVKKIGKQFKDFFTNLRVNIKFNSPHWICLAGDFRTREEAQAAMKRVEQTHKFKTCTVVRARIKNPDYIPSDSEENEKK